MGSKSVGKKMKDFVQPAVTVGEEMYALMKELYPICRSITGNGVRETFQIIQKHIPIKVHEVPTGTKVFDWTVPREWNIKDAYIKNSKGEKIVDFKKSNIHVLNYSVSVKAKMSLAQLKEHLFTLPNYPDRIPYLTTYYREAWGFCITHNQLQKLKEDTYEVVIDSTLKQGSLTYAELVIKGKSKEEILFSSYTCHPSLCNDNLSGPMLLVFLAKALLEKKNLKYSYRFLFIPETIGAIAWLSENEKKVKNIKCGLVATCLGDAGHLTYKRSRWCNHEIDKIVEKVLIDANVVHEIVDFFPSGSDERQFSSPGFNLPIGSLMRTMYAKFSEYHTSADDLSFVQPKYLGDTYEKYIQVVDVLENNKTYLNLNPKCEPQLGRRGLYSLLGGLKNAREMELAMFWVLNLSDGQQSLLDIAVRSKLRFALIKNAADSLLEKQLLREI